MSFKALLGDIIPRYIRLTKTEAKVLDTLITIRSGNAYGLWKASGLKHYPTVLRALKKIEEKRLVKVLSERGTRGEKTYGPTLVGTLVFYIFNGEEKKILKIVEENSSLFRELSRIEKADDWVFRTVQNIILDVYREVKEPRSIDQAIQDRVELTLMDCILNIDNKDRVEEIMKLSKVKRIRYLAIRMMKNERSDSRRRIEELEKLERKLSNL